MKSVAFITRVLTHYRIPFHEAVREELAGRGVKYRVIHGVASSAELIKGDSATLPWAEQVPTRYFGRGHTSWLSLPDLGTEKLLVLGQENGNLNNYGLQLKRSRSGPRIALFGHGKNFQARNSNALSEQFKRLWLRRTDWWFAYTERSAEIVRQAGFPKDRITVFQNAVDTSAIARHLQDLDPYTREEMRQTMLAGSHNVGVYIGGLYDLKRIPFLIEAAKILRRQVPDFQLLVIGGGPDLPVVEEAAHEHDWIHAFGPRFGSEKAMLASLGRVFLMPGLVGLGVLDSFAYGTPMVTTDLPYHSPEIDYLKGEVNGVIVREADDPNAFAAAAERVLLDEVWRDGLCRGGAEALRVYTVEEMAGRFAEGAMRALEGGK